MMEVAVKIARKSLFALPVKEDEFQISAVDSRDEQVALESADENSDDMSEPSMPRRKRFVPKYDVEGVARMVLSEETQMYVKTSVGADVTSEQPWTQAEKAAFLDHIETHAEDSELFALKKDLEDYPEDNILIGYIPDESKDYEEFYICYTIEARDHCLQQSEKFRRRQDKKIEKSINRKVRPWVSLGSDKEIDQLVSINKRSLIEVEITSRFPTANQPDKFTVRDTQDARDGYVELTPYRSTYDIINRLRVDRGTQVAPAKVSSTAQTVLRYPKNIWSQSMIETEGKENPDENNDDPNFVDDSTDTQSKQEYEDISVEKTEAKEVVTPYVKRLNEFVVKVSETVRNILDLNSAMDIYSNDYLKLVTSTLSTKYDSMSLEEYVCFTDMRAKGKYIIHASFHHFWSGVVAVAYADATPSIVKSISSREDQVLRAVYGRNPVLVWSHVDSLHPKLYLECDREVKYLSFCPFNENILVGGCINGQIVLWDISNKLEKAEQIEHMSETQEKFRMTITSQMGWMKSIHDKAIVRSTAVSNLQYNHQGPITKIQWLSPNYTVSSTGKVTRLQEGEKRSEIFLTSSIDATVLVWSLDTAQIEFIQGKKVRKSTRIQQKPAGLTVDISPYIVLDRTLQPIYKIMLGRAGVVSKFSAQSIVLDNLPIRYIPVTRNPGSGRTYFKSEIIDSEAHIELPIRVYAGSVYGDFIKFGWNGHEFNTGEVINSEYCNIRFRSKIHDGPVTTIAKNPFFDSAFISIGGKVFCLWSDHFDKPILWKKRSYRLTDVVWSQHKPSIFFISSSDGNIEVWDFLLRTDEPIHIQTVSGTLITGIYLHRRPIPKEILGVGDLNGSFRMFMLPSIFTLTNPTYIGRIQYIFRRQVAMKIRFHTWQANWAQENASFIEKRLRDEKSALAEREMKRRNELEEAQQKTEKELEAKKLEKSRIIGPEERWNRIITKLIEATIAIKKRINKEELYAQVKPLQELEEQRLEKEKKMQEIMKNQEHIFKETVAILFPEVISEEEKEDFKLPLGKISGAKKKYMEEYKHWASASAEAISSKPFKYSFEWKGTLAEGEERRRALDSFSAVLAKHRRRITVDGGVSETELDPEKIISSESVSLAEGDQLSHKVSFI